MRMYQYDKHLDFHALGREIKRKREEKGWTQEYLAQLVNRTPRSIMYMENRGAETKPQCFLPACHPAGDFRGSILFPGQAQRREHLPETDRCHAQHNGRKRANRNEIHRRGTTKGPGNGGCVRETRTSVFCSVLGQRTNGKQGKCDHTCYFCSPRGPQKRLLGSLPNPGTLGQNVPK